MPPFRCETLQGIRHPSLIIFFGAGTTSDGFPYMVRALYRFLVRASHLSLPCLTLRGVLCGGDSNLSLPGFVVGH